MKGKKKQLDFTVRPRGAKADLPADADRWVRGAKGPEKAAEEGPQKRLTLNLPADLHTAFKTHCVREGVTIQDKVRRLIERELTPATPPPDRLIDHP
jgi:ParG protein